MKLTGVFEVKKILKPTKAKLFGDLKVGDVIVIEQEIMQYNGNADDVVVKFVDLDNKEIELYSKVLRQRLVNFEWEEL